MLTKNRVASVIVMKGTSVYLYHMNLNFGVTTQSKFRKSVLLVIYYIYKSKSRMLQENNCTNAKMLGFIIIKKK